MLPEKPPAPKSGMPQTPAEDEPNQKSDVTPPRSPKPAKIADIPLLSTKDDTTENSPASVPTLPEASANNDSAQKEDVAASSSPEPSKTASNSSLPARDTDQDGPPLPDEARPPPLPNEAPPSELVDDGWEPVWDERAQAFYFFNRFTNATQWENPRVPVAADAGSPGVGNHERLEGLATTQPENAAGGYNPAIHGDYDPNADYAKVHEPLHIEGGPRAPGADGAEVYTARGAFNRFTGKWQNADLTPDQFNDESKSKRQMNAFFDVDAAANNHDGRSLRAERANKKLSKQELKAFKEKRREKKEEKRRAWLRD